MTFDVPDGNSTQFTENIFSNNKTPYGISRPLTQTINHRVPVGFKTHENLKSIFDQPDPKSELSIEVRDQEEPVATLQEYTDSPINNKFLRKLGPGTNPNSKSQPNLKIPTT